VVNFNVSTVNTSQSVNLNANQSAAGLVFGSTGTVSIQTGSGTNTLTIGASGITANIDAGTDTIETAVSLNGTQSWVNNSLINTLIVKGNVATGSNTLTIGGGGNTAIDGGVAGFGQVTKNGTGTLLLGGTADNVGLAVVANAGTVVLQKISGSTVHAVGGAGLTVAGGTVQLSSFSSIGDQIYDFSGVTVSGGAFDTNGHSETVATLSLQGTGIGGNGALTNSSASGASTITPTNGTVLTGNTTIGLPSAAASITLNNAVSGNFALTKVGAGTLILTGTNSFSGGLNIQNGSLDISTINNAGTNGVLGNNTSVTLGSSGHTGTLGFFAQSGQSNMPFVLATGGTGEFSVGGGVDHLVLTGTISGSGSLLASFGLLTLSGNNTFTGGVTINTSCSVFLGSAGAFNATSPNSLTMNGGTLYLEGHSVTLSSLNSNSTNALISNFSNGGAAATLTVNNAGGNSFSGILSDDSGGALSLTKTGAGTLTLRGNNTYSGITTVSAGTLQLGNFSALGSTAGGTLVASGATLDLGGKIVAAEPLNISGTGVGGNGALINSSGPGANLPGTVTFSGATTVGGTGDISLDGSVNSLPAFVLTKIGSGTLMLGGNTDNNNLGVTVNSGRVFLSKVSSGAPNHVHAIGQATLTVSGGTAVLSGSGGDQIYDFGSVTITSGTFNTSGRNETFAMLSLQGTGIGGAGALANSVSAASVLTPSGTNLTGDATIGVTQADGSLALNGAISGSFAVTKVGLGTLILNGSSSYSGGTTVSAGTLQVTNTTGSATGSGPVTIAASATLSGNGSITGNVTVDGTLSPGNSPGTLTVGSLTLNNGSQTITEIGGTTPGSTGYDHIAVTGSASAGGNLIVMGVAAGGVFFAPQVGQTFDIITTNSGVSGAFATNSLWIASGELVHYSTIYSAKKITLEITAIDNLIPGDFNGDGRVDMGDYIVWRKTLGTHLSAPDADHSGTVDQGDFNIWRANFGRAASASASGNNLGVPEPAGWVIFGWAVVVLFGARRGNRKR
jgi:autotransporter-associated beta strand protein